MKRQLNPLTLLFLLGMYLFTLFSADSWSSIGWYLVVLIVFGTVQRLHIQSVLKRIVPILMYLPVMIILYCAVSLVVSSDPFLTIIVQAIGGVARIVFIVSTMSVFLELVPSFVLIDAARTIWYRFGLKWRRAEDLFQLLDLVLRFFPMVTAEVKALMRLEKSLSFVPSHSRRDRIRKLAKQLPTLIVNCLHRAGQIGVAMEGRGYGTVLPRSVATPVEFTQRDGIVAIVMSTLLIGRLFIG
ncbi:MAG: hypothetical protein CMG71_07950 [Candidatus Marinimicrobia bacterium]|nr:hypothetical protein [Candidatus Neomarinimicrobiota bacterium]|tara:strand:- start:23184 stop:23909 length:726 start_codon:yes stop_codon:yes gene_type:complete